MKKICRLEVQLIFLQNVPSKSANFSSFFYLWDGFQMLLEGLSFIKTLLTFRNIYATDPLLQNMTNIACLLWLTVDIFGYKPL